MKKFINSFNNNIDGVISIFDRIIFKGWSPFSSVSGMESHLYNHGTLIKDFKSYCRRVSKEIRDFAVEYAQRNGRPYFVNMGKFDKEETARMMAQKDGIKDGLVCIFSAIEKCSTFKVVPGAGRPHLSKASIPCLCIYYYFISPEFGMMHIRIQSWFPLTVQIYLNGHEWLERKILKHGIKYEKIDNCFTMIGDINKAQKLADKFNRIKWEKIFYSFAKKINPLYKRLNLQYYWTIDQAEYATDVIFKNSILTEGLYEKLVERSTLRFGPKDILNFFGRKYNGHFTGDQISSMKRTHEGTRIKHWVDDNWIKMYNKTPNVLRVETVVNKPNKFKILRYGIRKKERIYGWFPMAKGISNMYRYAEISLAANGNYLDALSVVEDPRPAKESLRILTSVVVHKNRRYGAFNPVSEETIKLFEAVMNGDHIPFGFQNRDLRRKLFGEGKSHSDKLRLSAKTGRILKKLHVRKLICKIPRSRRWKVTEKGWKIMSVALEISKIRWHNIFEAKAA